MFGGSAPSEQPTATASQGFDMFGGSAPSEQPTATAPQGFDMFGGSAPVEQSAEVAQPATSLDINTTQTVPITAPIQENDNTIQQNQSAGLEDDPSMNQNNKETSNDLNTSSFQATAQEPIIITDYSKQYDPIMPNTVENMPMRSDFKEVINAIRDCSNMIEKYGYKIDLEEYDLNNMYQVVFKIEK